MGEPIAVFEYHRAVREVRATVPAGGAVAFATIPAGASVLLLGLERTAGGTAQVGDLLRLHDGAARLVEWECTAIAPEAWVERHLPDLTPSDPGFEQRRARILRGGVFGSVAVTLTDAEAATVARLRITIGGVVPDVSTMTLPAADGAALAAQLATDPRIGAAVYDGATLTITSAKPGAEGAITFLDNPTPRALEDDAGAPVGTHDAPIVPRGLV